MRELSRAKAADLPADSFRGQRPNLTDLHPRPFWQPGRQNLVRERETRLRLLARKSHRDHRAGAFVEDFRTQDECRTLTGLFAPYGRMQIGPTNLTSQYFGHASNSSDTPSSARALS